MYLPSARGKWTLFPVLSQPMKKALLPFPSGLIALCGAVVLLTSSCISSVSTPSSSEQEATVSSEADSKASPGSPYRKSLISLDSGSSNPLDRGLERERGKGQATAPVRESNVIRDKPRAYTGDLPYIAVCYARKNSDQVYPCIAQWQSAGYRVWYDEGIPLGVNWEDEVARRLAKADQVVFFLSQDTMKSHWTRRELSYSLNKKKEVLPLLLEKTDIPDGWAFLLNPIQFIELHRLSPERREEVLKTALASKARASTLRPYLRR